MIATWMLYCTAVSLLLGLAALALEHGLRARDWPVRWVWIIALSASLILPLVGWLAPRGEGTRPASSISPQAASTAIEILPMRSSLALENSPFSILEQLSGLLLVLWGFSSVVVLGGLIVLFIRIQRSRERWRTGIVAGVPVLVSRNTGPAVVGFRDPQIVLPEWVLSKDEETQRVVVEHESEHIRVGDPYLLLVAIAAVLAMPWNVAVWWQVPRLRLAIELDCDARVLRRQPDVRRYGMMLLDIGSLSAGGHPALAAFSEPQSFLERRIRIMTRTRPRTTWPSAVGFSALGALLILAACEAPQPGPVALAEPASNTGPVAGVAPADTTFPSISDESRREFGTLLEREYPPLLRDAGVEGQAVVDFVVDEQGIPQEIKLVRATHEAFGEAAIRAVRQARFTPARVGDTPVARRIQIPIAFKTTRSTNRNAEVKPRGTTTVGSATGDTTFPSVTDATRREIGVLLERAYPPVLRDAGVEGQAVIDFTVDEQGIPRDVKVERATHEAFGEAGVAVIRQARFNPARAGERAVAMRIQLPIAFKLAS